MKNQNIIQSFRAAFKGFLYIYNTHKHIKFNLLIGFLVFILAIFFKFNYTELLLTILAVILIFFAETINTCIEEVCNIITQDFHPKIKIIKDMGSFLVLLSVVFSIFIFIFLFIKKFL